ncbi:unnamed protein product [Amoebophrya sp. A25]|nr:unnamed protein product [Amoebophrya sp. A25]|eukprot:GSA25T00026092001.1
MTALVEKEQQEGFEYLNELDRGGFDFGLCKRNMKLAQALTGKAQFPQAKKTGTTICGIIVKDAVILGADTRATAGAIVADKNADKLHPIAPMIQCAGAGTSADLTATTELMERQMELHALNTGTQVRVVTVVRRLSQMLFRYQGHIGCHLVLGGYDLKGPHLYQIHAHGSTDKLPYTTMGSGSLAAMAVMEMRYKEDMTVEQGMELVADSISAGIFNDLGSGGNCDICVITKEGKKHIRGYRSENQKAYKAEFPPFPKGATPWTGESFKKRVIIEEGNTIDGDGDIVMG